MDSKVFLHWAVSIGAAALVAGCGPDTSERSGAAQVPPRRQCAVAQRPGHRRPVANRDATVRPPTTATNPAAPGSAAAPQPLPPRLIARAEIRPLEDNTARGVVEFQHAATGSSGPMTIHVMLMGLAAGPHGMHVHMGTDCAMPEEHLNPQNAPHGPANAASGMRHLGDLGNITADASGMVEETLRDSLLGGDSELDRQGPRRARGPGRFCRRSRAAILVTPSAAGSSKPQARTSSAAATLRTAASDGVLVAAPLTTRVVSARRK